jgi:hypothetical protein
LSPKVSRHLLKPVSEDAANKTNSSPQGTFNTRSKATHRLEHESMNLT